MRLFVGFSDDRGLIFLGCGVTVLLLIVGRKLVGTGKVGVTKSEQERSIW
jgi:hypothetical protein